MDHALAARSVTMVSILYYLSSFVYRQQPHGKGMPQYCISLLTISARINYVVNGCKSLLNSDGTEVSDGEIACYEAAYSRTGMAGVVSSVVNSCQGSHSCINIAQGADCGNGGDVGDIKDSCLGDSSCSGLAFSYTANGGSIGDITNSCHGIESCSHILAGGTSGDSGNVGDITCSCQGDRACYYLYSAYGSNDSVLDVEIESLSYCCNGAEECDDSSGSFTLPASCAANDYSDADSSTCPTTCGENEYVLGNICVGCPDGTINSSGDPVSGGDTACAAPPPVCTVDGVETPFVDCSNGQILDGTGTSCADACAALQSGSCCVGDYACDGFTGELVEVLVFVSLLPYLALTVYDLGKVCPDGSCGDTYSCENGTSSVVCF